ncbi:MAG TPA: helix-hairpin-helix domain-containing protein [Polyangiaceae bacterium]|nr:helix-hairpin-helix domain-containing protein [Polyangiaceae bacterium]
MRDLCERHGLLSRMPRYIPPGPLGVNKRIAEQLFLKGHQLDLELASTYRVWAYRKAAWAVDEWPTSIADLYREKGPGGLRQPPGVGDAIAREIERLLAERPAPEEKAS